MEFMDIEEYQEGAKKDFAALQERFRRNFDSLSEKELSIFRSKVFELLDLLRDKKT